mgnify:CR=1 FL=1
MIGYAVMQGWPCASLFRPEAGSPPLLSSRQVEEDAA